MGGAYVGAMFAFTRNGIVHLIVFDEWGNIYQNN